MASFSGLYGSAPAASDGVSGGPMNEAYNLPAAAQNPILMGSLNRKVIMKIVSFIRSFPSLHCTKSFSPQVIMRGGWVCAVGLPGRRLRRREDRGR